MKGSGSPVWLGYGQTVHQFKTAASASAVFAGLRAAMARCASFAVGAGDSRESISWRATTAPPVDGHKAFLVRISVTFPASGDHILQRMLFVLDGPHHVVASENSHNWPLPVSRPLTAIAASLISQLQELSQSSPH